jgi:integrase
MASAWIRRRTLADGKTVRWHVKYRLGGRETEQRHGGAFRTERDARLRRDWIAGELASNRVPDLALVQAASAARPLLSKWAERWKASRVDVAAGTMQTYDVALRSILEHFNDVAGPDVDAQAIADYVAALHRDGRRKHTIRKRVSVLAMILDHAGVQPNPARDKLTVKLPREQKRIVQPPTAAHVKAVVRLLPTRYRLPTLLLDATGCRVGELEALVWGDIDEPRGRWRIATSKTGKPRWVTTPPVLFERVLELVPREDRRPERRVFDYMTADRLRTAIGRACTAAGVPAFSPHDLRHRRVSLLHLGGMPWARIGELVGHDDLMTTARTYTHVVADEAELDYEAMLR